MTDRQLLADRPTWNVKCSVATPGWCSLSSTLRSLRMYSAICAHACTNTQVHYDQQRMQPGQKLAGSWRLLQGAGACCVCHACSDACCADQCMTLQVFTVSTDTPCCAG
jgi:hypothetical protein